ncbi:four helix bundle protein [candidate division KSB1 bacterium]|nr:four helix bundle protein [candidate division KSB1 bacterium]
MARYEHLPIFKKAYELVLYFDGIVRNFSRYDKFTYGTELRERSRAILMGIVQANNVEDKVPYLLALREKLEALKILIRLCKDSRVFPNLNSFQYSINEVVGLSQQNEGWLGSCRKINVRGQNF